MNYHKYIINRAQKKKPVVLVTGSSKGIGRAIAKKFAEEGYDVVITYNTDPKGAGVTERDCQKSGAETLVLNLDVREKKSIEKAVKKVSDKFGKVDVLINNAGVYREDDKGFSDMDAIQDTIQTNLVGMIQLTKDLYPNIKKSIVNIASIRGTKGNRQSPAYNSTKWGVRGFSRSLGDEGKFEIYNVNPDTISTQMTDFTGRPPEDVAKVVWESVKGKHGNKNGEDINVWEALGHKNPN